MSELLDDIMASAASLRPFSKVAHKALALLEDPDVSVARLLEVISLDTALTAAALKAANSARYGRPQGVDTLKQALSLLGNQVFKEIVFVSASAPVLGSEQPGYDLSAGDLWKHSVATSLMTQVLCERVKHVPGSALFSAGLLHDLGKSVLGTYVHERASQVQEEVRRGRTFLEAERAVLGVDHAELGARIAEAWSFSPAMVELIRYHHEPDARPDSLDVAILSLANLLCQMYGLGGGADGLVQRASKSVLVRLDLHHRDVEAVLAELHVRTARAAGLLALGDSAPTTGAKD